MNVVGHFCSYSPLIISHNILEESEKHVYQHIVEVSLLFLWLHRLNGSLISFLYLSLPSSLFFSVSLSLLPFLLLPWKLCKIMLNSNNFRLSVCSIFLYLSFILYCVEIVHNNELMRAPIAPILQCTVWQYYYRLLWNWVHNKLKIRIHTYAHAHASFVRYSDYL